jgi:hypothetical protein
MHDLQTIAGRMRFVGARLAVPAGAGVRASRIGHGKPCPYTSPVTLSRSLCKDYRIV